MRRAALVLLGLYVCVLGAVVHRHVWVVGGIDWPWGAALAVLVAYAVAVASGVLVRLGAAWFALGWAVGLLALQWSPGGSYLVAADWLGWGFTVSSLGVVVLAVLKSPRLVS
ncbi:hypothetical protein GEV29_08815 [Aeromicrobium sp. SMF47]|uniref:Uncharacterized protein n=1 Tax=Aeromicrobium yanjiei TaxID=2662028 RepID=A0A5Q2MKH2_9ACTN|nr:MULTISPECIES: hypothetical protein [Aeromicrobium]MRJ76635.1 hypothetical protein [Aeromicrobium yanjiei]MRK00982.1 hypothetical protein [Aeromicrobium sp. S22]QGG42213.1 hypothetical protein GEV26_13010 [Aeromicrobium yanjiei]